ncbi:hypothetical protein F1C11_32380 [Pseudomonas aeruginosa]|uniref:hypothetical protein n=1 Tax=Pseudomonas aeruginosa TaxID=287 RepID=UPI00122E0CE0|nr:hypothetical protein [Pseudomonas aeruginosa]KAA2294322.1 hypothetical protein F1C11_32380 [Pseudomonas aeruginosa]
MSNCPHEAWDFGALQCPDCGAVKGHVADADYAKLEAEAQALREEVAEYEALCNRQAELLSQSIVAIRGPEPELTRWGYADLPLRVKTIVEEVAALRARVAVVPDASTVYAALDARERLFTSPENIQVALEAQSRLNGLTVSEGLLRRIVTPALTSSDAQDRIGALEELRALLSEQEGGKQ